MLQADNQAGKLFYPAHSEQHAGHERTPVQRVVPQRQDLAGASKKHLLVGHKARQAHAVHRDAGRRFTARAARAGRLLHGSVRKRSRSDAGLTPGLVNAPGRQQSRS